MEEEKKEKGFVIKDRRHFDESGSVRKEEKAVTEKQSETQTDEPPSPPETADASETEEGPFPEINFTSFIFSLSTTAMYHFGDFPDPVTQKGERNLPAAKQTIDILSILKAKTEGNLDEDEKQLLEKLLFELRMRYVKEMTHR
jgi:hypothetical protein